MYTIEEGEDGAITIGEAPVAAAGLGYELSGNLPSQPYRLSGEHETYFHRVIGTEYGALFTFDPNWKLAPSNLVNALMR